MSTPPYTIEKPVWTEADFEQMGWHDVHIRAIAFHPEIFEFWLDIDYIFKWVAPGTGETHYSFWIAPATLAFENLYNVKFDIGSHDGGMELQGIKRSEASTPRNAVAKQTEWLWSLDCNEGQISFRSVGFSQFIRRPPVLTRVQRLTLAQRGGISFYRTYVA